MLHIRRVTVVRSGPVRPWESLQLPMVAQDPKSQLFDALYRDFQDFKYNKLNERITT